MTAGSEANRLLERLVADPAFRARFEADPADAARAAGFPGLAEELAMDDGGPMQTLELRESKSSLAGALMAAVAEGLGLFELGGHVFAVDEAHAATVPAPPEPANAPSAAVQPVDAGAAEQLPPAGEPAASPRWSADELGLHGTGGPITPEIHALLEERNVTFDASGVADLQAGRIDPRVVTLLADLSENHRLVVSSLCSDHAELTAGGLVSNHSYGRAVDIASVDGKPVDASNAAARRLALDLAHLDPSIRPSEIGSPWALPGAAYFTDADHLDHLHVGFDAPIDPHWTPPAEVASAGAAVAAPSATPVDPDDLEGNLDDEDAGADEVDGSNEDESDEGGGEDDDAGADNSQPDGSDAGGSSGEGGESDDADEGGDDQGDDAGDDGDEDEEDEDENEGADEPGEGSNGEDANDDADDGSSPGSDGSDSSDGSDEHDGSDGSDDSAADGPDGSDNVDSSAGSDDSSDGSDDSSDDSDDSSDASDGSEGVDGLDASDVYPGDGASREQIAAWMGAAAERRGLPPELPIMASLTEAGLRNLSYGDADSVGLFQMRTSIWDNGPYKGYAARPELQLRWFLDHAAAVKEKRLAAGLDVHDPRHYGDWIADVERPAEQYRGRYQLHLEAAQALLDLGGAGRNDTPSSSANDALVLPSVNPADLDTDSAGSLTGAELQGAIVQAAKSQLGMPYEWGGEAKLGSPTDCSGLLQAVLADHGIRIPRTTYDQFEAGRPVELDDLEPGDALFFEPGPRGPEHVGIYIGEGRFIEDPHTGGRVRVSELRGRGGFVGARRYIPG